MERAGGEKENIKKHCLAKARDQRVAGGYRQEPEECLWKQRFPMGVSFWGRLSGGGNPPLPVSYITDEDFWGVGKAFQEGDSVSKGMEVRYREMSGQKFLGLKGKLRSRACLWRCM